MEKDKEGALLFVQMETEAWRIKGRFIQLLK